MHLKANDTLHISAVGPDPIRPGERFEINDGDAQSLIDRGLASAVKAEPAAPENKMEPAPSNKSGKASAKKA